MFISSRFVTGIKKIRQIENELSWYLIQAMTHFPDILFEKRTVGYDI